MKPYIPALVLVCILSLGIFFSTSTLFAGTGNNASDYAWSSTVGWVKLNNCDDPADSATCSGPDYGVSVQDVAPGYLSGYMWSSNIGWISFNADAVGSGCVEPVNGSCRAFVDWANTSSGGVALVKGWARACSVFASGCSGTLKSDLQRGGWDGYIAMGTNTSSAGGWGVRVNSDNSITGYAWGSDVVGWLSFDGTMSLPSDMCPNINGNQTSIPNGYALDTNGNCVIPSTSDMCPNISGTQASVPDGYMLDGDGNCVPDTTGDVCLNLPGVQTSVPTGYTAEGGNCVLESGGEDADMCPNRPGVQLTVPAGMMIDDAGNCKINPIYIEV